MIPTEERTQRLATPTRADFPNDSLLRGGHSSGFRARGPEGGVSQDATARPPGNERAPEAEKPEARSEERSPGLSEESREPLRTAAGGRRGRPWRDGQDRAGGRGSGVPAGAEPQDMAAGEGRDRWQGPDGSKRAGGTAMRIWTRGQGEGTVGAAACAPETRVWGEAPSLLPASFRGRILLLFFQFQHFWVFLTFLFKQHNLQVTHFFSENILSHTLILGGSSLLFNSF